MWKLQTEKKGFQTKKLSKRDTKPQDSGVKNALISIKLAHKANQAKFFKLRTSNYN